MAQIECLFHGVVVLLALLKAVVEQLLSGNLTPGEEGVDVEGGPTVRHWVQSQLFGLTL